jgi:hypothetical protein
MLDSDQSRQRPPMPRMRAASARADESSVRLRHLQRLRYFPDLDRSEPGLNLLNVAFLV